MERSEAEAIYDAGREACVEMLLKLARQGARHEERLARLEESSRRDSRNSSVSPSADPPKTRAERRAQAKAKAKEWAKKEGTERRSAGAQPGHVGSGRTRVPEDEVDEIVDHYRRRMP